MRSLKDFFRVAFAAFAIACMISVTSCNSGSKDTMPVVNDNSAPFTTNVNSNVKTLPSAAQADSANTAKSETTDSNKSKSVVHVVTIENMKFDPATITINGGDQVTFINKDIVGHNATEMQNKWASPLLQTGQSWTFSPKESSEYYCTVHLIMKGKIMVK